ncbi:hypothetical protein FRACYDRAFT_240466 [Fragilariopsis cylindrus CCMP1102]|uniref:Uncharacterized protein n=1 Tax=Fragilariopsis cylindrus CCMP1102 TaxID=635003 RepID=A0A1E7FC86_9STRA|nr:hypothetical protein FRACYDRAFT_240466 [Fragilariopsis cylindrus CCMP1102]|eukprot:OEU15770.1 hypothetical protein FRACYDRAFT_240466 [Fragilariopsis cylindrus CCMP1102]
MSSSSHPQQQQQQVVHVHHHVDYRSKAEDRRRELEDLQQKKLAKTKAARLQDASAIPITDASNFLENMTRNRMVRRKNQADAIEFLHQYRADETITAAAAAAVATATATTGRWSLSSTKQYSRPDARASIYSYDVYPTSTIEYNNKNNTIAGTNKRDDDDNAASLQLPPLIDKNSINFEFAFKALGIIVKEASQVPLPDDNDDKNNNNINNDNNYIDNLLSFAEEAARSSNDEVDDTTLATTTPSSSLIPFESFRKLGESLSDDGSIDSIIPGESFWSLGASMMMANDNDINPSIKDDSKDEKDDNNNVDNRILLRKQAKQLREKKSGFKATLPLPVVYSQTNMMHISTNNEKEDDDDTSTIEGSKCLPLDTDINTEEEQIDDDTYVPLLDSDSVMSKREKDLQGRYSNNSEIVSQAPKVNSSKTKNGLNTFDNKIAERSKSQCDDSKIYRPMSTTGDSTIIEGSNDVTKVQIGINIDDESGLDTCMSKKKIQEQSIDFSESSLGRVVEFENKTPKKSNLTITISDNNIDSICTNTSKSEDERLQEAQSIQNDDVTTALLARRDVTISDSNKESNSTNISTSKNEKLQEARSIQNDDPTTTTTLLARMDATISDDNIDSTPISISISVNEKLQEAQSIQNHDPATTTPVAHVDARPRQPRRNRNRRKKKDEGYYPPSSLFVSRQFLSR